MNFEKLKWIRKKKGYTLARVSQATGYTASFLSQLERGLKEPSITTLRKLADLYAIPLVSLFVENEEDIAVDGTAKKAQPSIRIIRESERKKIMLPEIFTVCEFVTPANRQCRISGHITKLEPGCWCSESLISHTTDESAYIIKGNMKALLGDKIFYLGSGDSIYIEAYALHNWQNCGEETLDILTYMPVINDW